MDENADDAPACNDDTGMTTGSRCGLFIKRFACDIKREFTYLDLQYEAQRLDLPYTYGSLRNNMSRIVKHGEIVKFPSENPARFMWKQQAEKDSRWRRFVTNDKTPTGVCCHRVGGTSPRLMLGDYARFVKSLDWDELCYVHDVRTEFDIVGVPVGVSSESGWEWSVDSHSWLRRFDFLEFPLTVQLYDTGRVQVAVRCSLKPIPFDFEGLMRLTSVLGELKGLLQWGGIGNVVDWTVTSWHYGKDSRGEVSGPAFNVTFSTWTNTLGRIYLKQEIKRVRAEEVQQPNQSIQSLLRNALCNELDEKNDRINKHQEV